MEKFQQFKKKQEDFQLEKDIWEKCIQEKWIKFNLINHYNMYNILFNKKEKTKVILLNSSY